MTNKNMLIKTSIGIVIGSCVILYLLTLKANNEDDIDDIDINKNNSIKLKRKNRRVSWMPDY
jgi:hypothetical protein